VVFCEYVNTNDLSNVQVMTKKEMLPE